MILTLSTRVIRFSRTLRLENTHERGQILHELSIATQIVKVVTGSLADHPGAKIKLVKLTIGTHAGIEIDALRFCFPLATQGSPINGAELIIVSKPLRVACRSCLEENDATGLQCPACQSADVSIVAGRELEVSSIEVDV